MSAEGDRAVAAQAAAGDAAAFATLVESHAPRLHRWLVATGTAHHDAEDVVQEAFLRAHAAIARYDARWAFSTWIFTIAHRVRLDLAARRRDHAPLEDVHATASAPADPLPAGGLWRRARDLLPEDDFRLLWLHYAEDQAPSAVARVLGINPIAARVRLHRARKRLEAALRADPSFTPAEALS
jgi:RNA polymerase sigma-70 factor (ECF subfamily)